MRSSLELHYHRADRIMLAVIWLMALASLGWAAWHGTWLQAVLVGGGTAAALTLLQQLVPGQRLLRCAMGAGFMVLAALHINQSHGLVEVHFGIFALLAFLVYYRDWLPIVSAAAVIAVHHLSFYWLQTQGGGVHVVEDGSWPIIFLHALYVVVETAILVYMAVQARAEADQGAALMDIASHLDAGNGQVDLRYRSAQDGPLVTHFNRTLTLLDELVTRLVDETRGLGETSQSLMQTTARLETGAHDQLDEGRYMNQAIGQMTSAIDEVAGHADQAALTARRASAQSAEGSEAVNGIRREIEQLARHIDGTDRDVQALAEQAEQIGRVLEVISSIADQTNLLALNAAIEAARAGDQGRGFAVVADEVRQLAQKTAVSTTEIRDIIGRLQQGSRQAAEAMRDSRTSVGRCVENSGRTAELLEAVAQQIGQISEMNERIAAATHQQAAASDNVNQHLARVQQVAEQNAGSATTLSTDGQRLTALNERLQRLSGQFRTGAAR